MALALPLAGVALALIAGQMRSKRAIISPNLFILLRKYLAFFVRRNSTLLVRQAVGISSLSLAFVLIRNRNYVQQRIRNISSSTSAPVAAAEVDTGAVFTPSPSFRAKFAAGASQVRDAVSGQSNKLLSVMNAGLQTVSAAFRSGAEAIQDRVYDNVETVVDGVVGNAADATCESLKLTLKDPAMPKVVKRFIDETVEIARPDMRIAAQKFATEVRGLSFISVVIL